jgi:LmbE family N-acetylglucosaminyl deacetylase
MYRSHFSPTTTVEHGLAGEKLSLLAVFAHPEDESFGPAGTLARYATEGIQVTLVTATRATHSGQFELGTAKPGSRDRVCSCRASGIRRACFFDNPAGELSQLDPLLIEDQLVRLIRQVQPQVMITLDPRLFADDLDHIIISRVAAAAFRDADDATKFPDHFKEGLGTYGPQKLYHCVLPASLLTRWAVDSVCSVPDDRVTTVLDVSSYGEAMKNALYCQRSHAVDFIRWLTEDQNVSWDSEYYSLVESRLNRRPRRERDLFQGLR